jgi:hypothetical protein
MKSMTIRAINSKLWTIVGTTTLLCSLYLPIDCLADDISELRQSIEQMMERLERLESEKALKTSAAEEKPQEEAFKSFEFHGYSRAGFG